MPAPVTPEEARAIQARYTAAMTEASAAAVPREEQLRRRVNEQWGVTGGRRGDIPTPAAAPTSRSAPEPPRKRTVGELAGSREFHQASVEEDIAAAEAEPLQSVEAGTPVSALPPRQQEALGRLREAEAEQIRKLGMFGAGGQAAQGRVAEAERALLQRRPVTRGVPMYPVVQEYVGKRGAAETERIEGAKERILGEQFAQRAAVEQAKTNVVGFQARMAEQEATEAIRQERREETMEAQKVVQLKLAGAEKMLAETPDIDPNRYWENKSTGEMIMLTIAAALSGFTGHGDPVGQVQKAIAADIQAQKDSIAGRQTGYRQYLGALKEQQGIYAQMLDDMGDPYAAELMAERAYNANVQRQSEAKAMEAGLRVLPGTLRELNAGLDVRNAEIDRELSTLAVNTPEKITRMVGPGRAQREILKGRLEEAREAEGEMRRAGIATVQEGVVGGEGGKEARAQSFKETENLQRRRASFGKDVEKIAPAIFALRQLRKEVSQEGAWSIKGSRLRDVGTEEYVRAVSGAAVSESEREAANDLFESYSQESALEKIDMMLGSLDSRVEGARRSHGADAARLYFHGEEAQPAELSRLGQAATEPGASGRELPAPTPR